MVREGSGSHRRKHGAAKQRLQPWRLGAVAWAVEWKGTRLNRTGRVLKTPWRGGMHPVKLLRMYVHHPVSRGKPIAIVLLNGHSNIAIKWPQ